MKIVFLYPFSNKAISPENNEQTVFYTGKLYGLAGMYQAQCKSYNHTCSSSNILVLNWY